MVEVGIVLTDGLKDTALPTTRMCAQWMDNLCQLAHHDIKCQQRAVVVVVLRAEPTTRRDGAVLCHAKRELVACGVQKVPAVCLSCRVKEMLVNVWQELSQAVVEKYSLPCVRWRPLSFGEVVHALHA
eukprot:6808701-Prymnesium_polylepis.3